jgi:hypothetical protein
MANAHRRTDNDVREAAYRELARLCGYERPDDGEGSRNPGTGRVRRK